MNDDRCVVCGTKLKTIKKKNKIIVHCPNPKCDSIDVIFDVKDWGV